jgi:hypothetical protein
MGMFELSDEKAAEFREQVRGYAQEKITDEPIVAAGLFRRGGSTLAMGASQLSGLAYAGARLFSKKKAGGLPDQALLVATPTKLRAYKIKPKGRRFKIGDEVAVWERAGLRASTEGKMGLTMLTIESPAEGEKVTIAPIGVRDDPVSSELMRVVVEGLTEAPTGA